MINTDHHFTIGFIGLGLIGGSIAKSIRRVFPNYQILAYDKDLETLRIAKEDGTISTIAASVNHEFSNCNYIFLCSPVYYNIEYLDILKDIINEACIITDVGSTKSDIYEAIKAAGLSSQYIGGHPMVGSEHSGFEAANDHLIENAYYFITPTPDVPADAVDQFMMLIDELGALTLLFSPIEHDSVTASISHIPHIIAAAIVNLVKKRDTNDHLLKKLAAGGFKDITRIASSSPTVWEHICLTNSENIITQLDEFIALLQAIITAIKMNDENGLLDFFGSAREYRDSIHDSGVGVIRKSYEVYVDIADQPGTIAGVATVLADNNISIKNIGIIHNREYAEGALQIVLYNDESAIEAANVLNAHNYTVKCR